MEAGRDQSPAVEERIAKVRDDIAELSAKSVQTFEVSSRQAASEGKPAARKPTVPAN